MRWYIGIIYNLYNPVLQKIMLALKELDKQIALWQYSRPIYFSFEDRKGRITRITRITSRSWKAKITEVFEPLPKN